MHLMKSLAFSLIAASSLLLSACVTSGPVGGPDPGPGFGAVDGDSDPLTIAEASIEAADMVVSSLAVLGVLSPETADRAQGLIASARQAAQLARAAAEAGDLVLAQQRLRAALAAAEQAQDVASGVDPNSSGSPPGS